MASIIVCSWDTSLEEVIHVVTVEVELYGAERERAPYAFGRTQVHTHTPPHLHPAPTPHTCPSRLLYPLRPSPKSTTVVGTLKPTLALPTVPFRRLRHYFAPRVEPYLHPLRETGKTRKNRRHLPKHSLMEILRRPKFEHCTNGPYKWTGPWTQDVIPETYEINR